jgi:hypothetical protein
MNHNLIDLKVVSVFSEHAYTQHSWLKIQDADHKLWQQLRKFLDEELSTSIYPNHFVFKCEDEEGNTIYLGYNDSQVSFGFSIGKMWDSKETVLESPIELLVSF